MVRLDGTNLLVFGGVILIAAAGSWQFIGTFLVWAVWQVVLYYLVLIVVALVLYGALFVAVGREEERGPLGRWRDPSDETVAE